MHVPTPPIILTQILIRNSFLKKKKVANALYICKGRYPYYIWKKEQ